MKGAIHRHTGPRNEQRPGSQDEIPFPDAGDPPGDAWCPDCSVVFRGGRWAWGLARKGAPARVCPACQRIRDRFPGGYLKLKGSFVEAHRDELHRMVEAREAQEKAEHPLERVMAVHDWPQAIEISTTGTHLARALGHALQAAYDGRLNVRYQADENLVRAVWTREAGKPGAA